MPSPHHDGHLHLHGSSLEHPHWSAEERDDFDAAQFERALIEARRREYASLTAADAA